VSNVPLHPHWFFQNQEAVAALRAEAATWIGTPFRAHSKAKGRSGGVDCIRLCEAIVVKVGLTEPFEFPKTPMDFSMHQERSIVLEFLRGEADDPQSATLARIFEQLGPEGPVMPGDLLAFKIGRAVHHLAIAIDDVQFIHCFRGIGTVYGNLSDSTYASRLHSIFRARA
jgi:cell wall-associated NlpC family hydrolase